MSLFNVDRIARRVVDNMLEGLAKKTGDKTLLTLEDIEKSMRTLGIDGKIDGFSPAISRKKVARLIKDEGGGVLFFIPASVIENGITQFSRTLESSYGPTVRGGGASLDHHPELMTAQQIWRLLQLSVHFGIDHPQTEGFRELKLSLSEGYYRSAHFETKMPASENYLDRAHMRQPTAQCLITEK
jgi:hypothetical protein